MAWGWKVAQVALIITTARSTSLDMTRVFHKRIWGRFIVIQSNLRRKKLCRKGGNRDNIRAPIQLRTKRQTQHLKGSYLLKNKPIHFHINSTIVIRLVKWNKFSFSSIKLSKSFPVQSAISQWSDWSSGGNSSCYHRSDASWSYLE